MKEHIVYTKSQVIDGLKEILNSYLVDYDTGEIRSIDDLSGTYKYYSICLYHAINFMKGKNKK